MPYWDVDAGMAALLMLLTAVDEGLGACFFGVPPDRVGGVPGGVRRARRRTGRSAASSVGYPGHDDRRSPSLRRGRRGGRGGRAPRPLVTGSVRSVPPVEVGRVGALARYPVKSLQGESLEAVEVDERGLRGDRGWAAYTADGGIGSGKTTRRFRRIDGLLHQSSALDDGAGPGAHPGLGGAAPVRRTGHRCGPERRRGPARVTLRPETDVQHHDEAPVHVLTTASLRHLERLLGAPVDVRRLRPNVVLEVEGDGFVEDAWIGRDLRLGDVVLTLGPGMPRCVMVDAAQAGVPTTPPLLRTLGRVNDTQLGLQATVRAGGVRPAGGRRPPAVRLSRASTASWSAGGAGVAALLGVELGGRQRAVLDAGDEPVAVLGPGDQRLGQRAGRPVGREREVADAVGVHEVEALVGQAVEQDGARRRLDGVPAHVRQHRRLELLDDAGPLAAALGVVPVLDPAVEEDLHADADAEDRTAAGQPPADEPRPVDGAQPGHAGGERARRRGRRDRRRPAPPAKSEVTVTSAPTRARARSTERRLPDP